MKGRLRSSYYVGKTAPRSYCRCSLEAVSGQIYAAESKGDQQRKQKVPFLPPQ